MKEDWDIYGQRKQISQLPVVGSRSVELDHWRPYSFMTSDMSKDILSRTPCLSADRGIYVYDIASEEL